MTGDSSRCDELLLNEARVLLDCRHPNVLFMLGFILDHPGGPVFIMERTWGTVAAALTSGPLALETTDSIAVQVASALSYMQEMRISHGGLGIRSVFLAELKGSIGEGPNHSNHSNSFKT